MLIRTKFSKLDPVRYISHLELMTTIRRACRRADLPVAYTEGYNPHIKLSMGQPLSVGMIGQGEYFDLELVSKIEIGTFINRLNQALPCGIRILEAVEVPSGIKSLQAVVNTAVYNFSMEFNSKPGITGEKELLADFYARPEIKIIRRRRNKEDREIDLKPMIYEAEVIESGLWKFTVSTGSQGNVRPAEVVRALADRYSAIKEIPLIKIERKGMFVRKDDKLFKPFAESIVRR